MNPGFHDPIAIKKQRPKDKPKEELSSTWNFTCPQYDHRTNNFVNAGTHYGTGHNQPVGSIGQPKANVPCLPSGCKQVVDEKA